jgi:3-hydroxyacyl-[acyl-carrier-protein] dehydratase
MNDLSFLTIDNNCDILDHERIKQMIPHRFPMLMVDKVVNMRSGESALGIKNVSSGEPFFSGHFPDQAVMPGVMMVEAMAQTAGVLVVYTLGKEAEVGFAVRPAKNPCED